MKMRGWVGGVTMGLASLAIGGCTTSVGSGNPNDPQSGTPDGQPAGGASQNAPPSSDPKTGTGAPLTSTETGMVGVWLQQEATVDGRRSVMIFRADRSGCYYELYSTGVKARVLGIKGWRLGDAEVPTNTKSVSGLPILYTNSDGNEFKSDLYAPNVGEIYPSGVVRFFLDKTDKELDCRS